MPWVVRDVVRDINKASGRRWQAADTLLPVPGDLPEGCGPPFLARAANGRQAGLAVCRHQEIPDDSIGQTWGAATRFVLTPRVGQASAEAALGQLLGQWRDHLAAVPEAGKDDTSALLYWPARDITGITALVRHGLQPLAVIAAREGGRTASRQVAPSAPGQVAIRAAGPGDEAVVAGFELGVVEYDAHFGGAVRRPATATLIRAEVSARLARPLPWTWLAERDGRAVGMIAVQQPQESAWISSLTSASPAVYLPTGYVIGEERGAGIGAALVAYVHEYLAAVGIGAILLHYALVNPMSGPFWSRMGYRPLWTTWEIRPAAALRNPSWHANSRHGPSAAR